MRRPLLHGLVALLACLCALGCGGLEEQDVGTDISARSSTETVSVTPSLTASPSPTSTEVPTETPTPTPTETLRPAPTRTETPTTTETFTPTPTDNLTPTATDTSIPKPTKELSYTYVYDVWRPFQWDGCDLHRKCRLQWTVVVVEWDGVDTGRLGRILAEAEPRFVNL